MNRKKDGVSVPSAASLIERLRQDPAYMAKHADRERRRDARRAELAKVSAPMLFELAAVGLAYSSVDELRQSGTRYEDAIPILAKWLPLVPDLGLKQSIVRALSVPWAGRAAIPLITEFKNTNAFATDSLKWAIGNALAVVAGDNVFDEISELVRDKRHGKSREMLAVALGNMRDPRATELLIELLGDEELVGHALVAIGKLKARDARPQVELLLNHPKPWVRKKAKQVYSKLDK
jgi:hypothetical protein